MEEKILDIKDLSVIYKTDLETVEAVNGIDLSIGRGRTYGLVGETGAGKTTTALSILGLLPEKVGQVTKGSISFEGQDLLQCDEQKLRELRGRKIAMVFQDPMTSLNPVMSVGDQIAEVLTIHNGEMSKEEIDKRVEHTLSMVGILPSRKKDYPHQFSGGMKQRVVIAMALTCEPDLLIADEPTTALDVTIQAQVLMMIKELRNRLGTSMLMITHDLGIVARICDDVGIMYAGKIVESGSVEDIFSGEAHHPYTEGLFGSIPNLKSRASRLKPIMGLMPDPTDLPSGCVFSPRCKHCMEICSQEAPAVRRVGNHAICCHLFDENLKKTKPEKEDI